MSGPRIWIRHHCLLRRAAWICCALGVAAGAWPGMLPAHVAALSLATASAGGHPPGRGSEAVHLAATALEIAALTLSAAVFGDLGGPMEWRAILIDVITVYVATAWLGFAAAAATFAAILGR